MTIVNIKVRVNIPRPLESDRITARARGTRGTIESERRARQNWYKYNQVSLWNRNIGPIQNRIMAKCQTKIDLSRRLTESLNEYLKFSRRTLSSREPAECSQTVARLVYQTRNPHEKFRSTSFPMIQSPPIKRNVRFQGISREGFGTYGYLQNRYNSGLPETKYGFLPTSNSVYAWKLLEAVRSQNNLILPRRNAIQTFYRVHGAFREVDYAPFNYP